MLVDSEIYSFDQLAVFCNQLYKLLAKFMFCMYMSLVENNNIKNILNSETIHNEYTQVFKS